jgi:hypothetical protein
MVRTIRSYRGRHKWQKGKASGLSFSKCKRWTKRMWRCHHWDLNSCIFVWARSPMNANTSWMSPISSILLISTPKLITSNVALKSRQKFDIIFSVPSKSHDLIWVGVRPTQIVTQMLLDLFGLFQMVFYMTFGVPQKSREIL